MADRCAAVVQRPPAICYRIVRFRDICKLAEAIGGWAASYGTVGDAGRDEARRTQRGECRYRLEAT